jgi:hypothetical protein
MRNLCACCNRHAKSCYLQYQSSSTMQNLLITKGKEHLPHDCATARCHLQPKRPSQLCKPVQQTAPVLLASTPTNDVSWLPTNLRADCCLVLKVWYDFDATGFFSFALIAMCNHDGCCCPTSKHKIAPNSQVKLTICPFTAASTLLGAPARTWWLGLLRVAVASAIGSRSLAALSISVPIACAGFMCGPSSLNTCRSSPGVVQSSCRTCKCNNLMIESQRHKPFPSRREMHDRVPPVTYHQTAAHKLL